MSDDTRLEDAQEQTSASAADAPGVATGRIVLGGLLVVLGVVWLLDAAGAIDLQWRVVLPAVLTVIGLALLATARRGAHGGLVATGIVLSVLVLLISGVTYAIPLGGVGERVERPSTVAEAEEGHSLAMGQLTVDLRDVADLDDDVEVSVSVGMGEMLVLLPEGVGAEVGASAGAGEVAVLDATRSGVGISMTETAPGDPTVTLDLSVGMGRMEVRR